MLNFCHPLSLSDVVQSEGRLYLVFEFVDKDLKKYFEACDGPLSAALIKVTALDTNSVHLFLPFFHLFLVTYFNVYLNLPYFSRMRTK
jgi:hypothetical protein